MLYLVPTPIGNLSDITIRAIEILRSVDIVLAEDTRQTGKLFKAHQIETKLQSFHSHNEHKQLEIIISKIKGGVTYALVSDAGSPGISDPGFLIARECQRQSIIVSALPGPTAFVPALTASGLASDKFYFEGFLPQKKGRQTRWKALQNLDCTVILYESPYRLLKCLREILEYFGEQSLVCVAREISKIHEEISTKSIKEMIADYQDRPSIKGEIVVIIGKR